ncbi:DUF1285 domain-containing protein [Psychrobacter lutiphocae]|uniref:DUF1285 domain-containing protein n=1 Tax=Psychrobacter lutiphocae TaxID=540500 RepID=UPI00037FD79D|nr:DUF1285 domain-containing protein [Psychrobacter lutiphocae]
MSNNTLNQVKTAPVGLEDLVTHLEPSIIDTQQSDEQPQAMLQGPNIPPLKQWQPNYCADMDLLIKANGEWWHEGRQIMRQSLIDLFATILWREGSDEAPQYFLKTPVEKMRIQVEDVPFFITQVNEVQQQGMSYLQFVTATGDVVYLTEDNLIEMRPYYPQDSAQKQSAEPEYRPYIPVRFGMYGLISRSVFMHLVGLGEITEQDGETRLSLISGGKTHHLSVPS